MKIYFNVVAFLCILTFSLGSFAVNNKMADLTEQALALAAKSTADDYTKGLAQASVLIMTGASYFAKFTTPSSSY